MKDRWTIHPLDKSPLAAFADQWDSLNQRLLAAHPMLDSRYLIPLLHYFGDGREHLCLFEGHGEVQAMAILKPARPGIWAAFVPAKAPGFPLAPLLADDPRALARLAMDLPGWVGQVDWSWRDPDLLPALPGPLVPHRRLPHAHTMRVGLTGSFDDYWQSRSGNLRGTLRQRLNRLAKAGLGTRLVRLDAPEDMAAAVKRYAALESQGWKGKAGSALSADNAKGRFYGDVLESFARTGQAAVYEYWIDDRHAASQLVISNRRMVIYLKTTYDEALASYSPGLLLLRELIRDCFERLPGGAFEFYTNTQSSPQQLAWGTEERWIEHVSLYRNGAVRQVVSALRSARSLAGPLQAVARSFR